MSSVSKTVLRERGDRQRRQRPSAHRIHVAQRIRRRDLTVDIRVVDDRREEIHRLHQRRSALPRVHTCIVRSPVVDQDAWISLGWYAAQDLSELAGGEFARSTSAADHLGQPPFVDSVIARHGDIRAAASSLAFESASLVLRLGQVLVEPLQFVLVRERDRDRAALALASDLHAACRATMRSCSSAARVWTSFFGCAGAASSPGFAADLLLHERFGLAHRQAARHDVARQTTLIGSRRRARRSRARGPSTARRTRRCRALPPAASAGAGSWRRSRDPCRPARRCRPASDWNSSTSR